MKKLRKILLVTLGVIVGLVLMMVLTMVLTVIPPTAPQTRMAQNHVGQDNPKKREIPHPRPTCPTSPTL